MMWKSVGTGSNSRKRNKLNRKHRVFNQPFMWMPIIKAVISFLDASGDYSKVLS